MLALTRFTCYHTYGKQKRKQKIANIYNFQFPSSYQWVLSQFLSVYQKLESLKIFYSCSNLVITCGINFSNTNWRNMCSNNAYQITILDHLVCLNVLNFAPSHLDVFVCKTPELILISNNAEILANKLRLSG